jgi:hypothetical protein
MPVPRRRCQPLTNRLRRPQVQLLYHIRGKKFAVAVFWRSCLCYHISDRDYIMIELFFQQIIGIMDSCMIIEDELYPDHPKTADLIWAYRTQHE